VWRPRLRFASRSAFRFEQEKFTIGERQSDSDRDHGISAKFLRITPERFLFVIMFFFFKCLACDVFDIGTRVCVHVLQDRMAFAAANLSCAAAAIRKHREILTVALGGLCAQFLWLCVWLLALLGCALSHHRERQESLPPSSPQYAAYEASTGWPGTEHAAEENAAEQQEKEHESGNSGSSSSGGSGDGHFDNDDGAKPRHASLRVLKKKHKQMYEEPIAPSPMPSSYTSASNLNNDDGNDDGDDAASQSLAGLSELLAANSDAAAAAAAEADDLSSSSSSTLSPPEVTSSTDSSDSSASASSNSSNSSGAVPESDPMGYYYSYYDDNSLTDDQEPIGSHGGAPNFGQGHKYGKNKGSSGAAAGGSVGGLISSNEGVSNVGEEDEITVSEYYGLGAGCKTIFVDHKDVADFHLESLTNGTYGVYCACNHGGLLSLGTCDSSDFFYVELAQNAWLYVLFAASLFWGFQVIAGVVHVTSAGAVASWWFDTKPPLPAAPSSTAAVGSGKGSNSRSGGGGGGAYASVPNQDPEAGQGSLLPPPPSHGQESYSPGAGTGHKVTIMRIARYRSHGTVRWRSTDVFMADLFMPRSCSAHHPLFPVCRYHAQVFLIYFTFYFAILILMPQVYGIAGPPGSPGATGAAARRADMQQRLAEFKARKSLQGSSGVGAGGANDDGDEEDGEEKDLVENDAEKNGAAKNLFASQQPKKSSKAALRSARAKGNGTDANDDNSVDTAVAFRALQVMILICGCIRFFFCVVHVSDYFEHSV